MDAGDGEDDQRERPDGPGERAPQHQPQTGDERDEPAGALQPVADGPQAPHRVVRGQERRAQRPEKGHVEVGAEKPGERARILHSAHVLGQAIRDRVESPRAEPGAGRDALQRAELEEVVSHERGERQLGEAQQRGEEHRHDERASDACDLRSAQAAARRRAIRSSSGGCDAKTRMNFVELDIRKAAIAG